MIELHEDEFKYIKKIFSEDNEHYPLVKSIISHNIDGKVFVDNFERCESVFLANKLGWVYFLGNEKNEKFNANVEQVLKSNYLKNCEHIIWFGISDYWKERVKERLNKNLLDFPRIQYIFKLEKYQSVKKTNSSYQILEIAEENIEKSIEFDGSITNFWRTKEEFLRKGFGYIVLDGGKVVSQSISASIEDGEVEIDVMTDMKYRRKGLARLLSMYLIEKSLEKGLLPKWDCSISNKPSKMLAEKLGFESKQEYPVSLIEMKE